MIHRILHILIALAAIAGSASAQSLSVQPIEAQTGEQAEVVVSLTGGASATALQFNLKLPEGVSVNANGATLGTATNGHTLSVETLDSGDLLFVLYSMDLNTFTNGELLRIPVTAGNSTTTATGQLSTVRTATVSDEEAVSVPCEDATFSISITSGVQKCATPVLSYMNGRVTCTCTTEDVTYVYSINPTASTGASANGIINLATSYTVSVHAVREGYEDSDTATLVVNQSQVGDVNGDGIVTIADVTALVNIILGK